MREVFKAEHWFMDSVGWLYTVNGTKLARLGGDNILYLWDKRAKCEVAVGLIDLHRADLIAALRTEGVEWQEIENERDRCY